MERSPRNVLLIELIIVIFFFSLSAVITLQAFVRAYEDTLRSNQYNQALTVAQDWAERLYAAKEPEALLQQAGWQAVLDGYETEWEDFHLSVSLEQEVHSAGEIRRMRVTVLPMDRDDEQAAPLVSLPVARYMPASQEVP